MTQDGTDAVGGADYRCAFARQSLSLTGEVRLERHPSTKTRPLSRLRFKAHRKFTPPKMMALCTSTA